MKKKLLSGIFIFCVTFSAYSGTEPKRGDIREEIIAVIQAQLDAFQRDDGEAAFSLASPGIQERFQTSENFLNMVIAYYPAVYRPKQIEFLELRSVKGIPVQMVYLVGPDGLEYLALYPMEKQIKGSWKTDGCYLNQIE